MINNHNKNTAIKYTIMIATIIALVISPLIFSPKDFSPKDFSPKNFSDREFVGTDDKAKDVITEINKGYKPWFKPLWQPPSKEIESLIFTLQASIGSAVIAFYLGYLYGKNKNKVT